MSHYVLGVAARRRCDTASTFAIERRMLTAITAELGKTPEVLYRSALTHIGVAYNKRTPAVGQMQTAACLSIGL